MTTKKLPDNAVFFPPMAYSTVFLQECPRCHRDAILTRNPQRDTYYCAECLKALGLPMFAPVVEKP